MITIRNPYHLLKKYPECCLVVFIICIFIPVLLHETSQFIHENYEMFTCLCATFYMCVFLLDWLLLPVLKKVKILQKIVLWKYNDFGYVLVFICVIAIYCTYSKCEGWHFLLSVLFSVVHICLKQKYGYTEADVNNCQKCEESIGAYWARQAYDAYYEIVLKNITERISLFAKENNVKFYVEKLVIILPSSCDARNTLTSKDEKMEYVSDLKIIKCDQGANVNREYRNPVYRISNCDENVYIAAENPSCLLTLWEVKDIMKKEVWNYHKSCFARQLRYLVRDSPCIVLDYDDLCDSPEPLHQFLLSALTKKDTSTIISFE